MVPFYDYRVVIKSKSGSFSCVRFVQAESLNDAWSEAEDVLHDITDSHKEAGYKYKWFIADVKIVNEVK